MKPDRGLIGQWKASLPERARRRLEEAAAKVADAKLRGKGVVVVTGSGPNIHEGVTTLVAELIHKGIVDGVITSSAVVAHEMAGTLDRVRRVVIRNEGDIGFPKERLPKGGVFEVTLLSPTRREQLESEITTGWEMYDRLLEMPGDIIIKAAGNMGWPMGLWTEQLARTAEELATRQEATVEQVVGLGADPMTMIGAGVLRQVPVIVSTPQLIGGGAVGLAIGDAISISRRARMVAEILESAEVIVESAIALSQEIHDGPFETYTGHGIWSAWLEQATCSLRDKTLIRIDLDPNLELAWNQERQASTIQMAVDRGLPKTKLTGVPFRMEMSGFARLEGSIPVTADIGVAWPILASSVAGKLGVELDFVSAPQETQAGRLMREWIVEHVWPVDKIKMQGQAKEIRSMEERQ